MSEKIMQKLTMEEKSTLSQAWLVISNVLKANNNLTDNAIAKLCFTQKIITDLEISEQINTEKDDCVTFIQDNNIKSYHTTFTVE